MKENEGAIANQIEKTGDRLRGVEEALHYWKPGNKAEDLWVNHFKSYVPFNIIQSG